MPSMDETLQMLARVPINYRNPYVKDFTALHDPDALQKVAQYIINSDVVTPVLSGIPSLDEYLSHYLELCDKSAEIQNRGHQPSLQEFVGAVNCAANIVVGHKSQIADLENAMRYFTDADSHHPIVLQHKQEEARLCGIMAYVLSDGEKCGAFKRKKEMKDDLVRRIGELQHRCPEGRLSGRQVPGAGKRDTRHLRRWSACRRSFRAGRACELATHVTCTTISPACRKQHRE